jgi:hypothetical protein
MTKIILIAIISLFLAGCVSSREPLRIVPEFIDRPTLNVPEPRPARQLTYEWIVITQDNYERIFEELRNDNGTITLFAVTATGYERINLNSAEVRRFIQQQNAVIRAMRQYYERPE